MELLLKEGIRLLHITSFANTINGVISLLGWVTSMSQTQLLDGLRVHGKKTTVMCAPHPHFYYMP